MHELDLVSGKYTTAATSKRDSTREYDSYRSATEKAKALRIAIATQHATKEKAAKECEGKTYGFAAFAGLDNNPDSDSD